MRGERRRTRRGRRLLGFSLVEAMVALGVMGIAGAGAITLIHQLGSVNQLSRKRSDAAALARETIDSLIASGSIVMDPLNYYNSISSLPSPMGACGGCGAGGCTCTTAVGDLQRTVELGPVDAMGRHAVNITITFPYLGGTRDLVVKTVVGTP